VVVIWGPINVIAGTRVGIWFSFNGWAQILGGLVAYAIARGVDKHGSAVEGWKINFVSILSKNQSASDD